MVMPLATDTEVRNTKNGEGIICNYGELKEYESAFVYL